MSNTPEDFANDMNAEEANETFANVPEDAKELLPDDGNVY